MECCAQKFVRLRKVFRIGENLYERKDAQGGGKNLIFKKKVRQKYP